MTNTNDSHKHKADDNTLLPEKPLKYKKVKFGKKAPTYGGHEETQGDDPQSCAERKMMPQVPCAVVGNGLGTQLYTKPWL